jgi:hypothetical protein
MLAGELCDHATLLTAIALPAVLKAGTSQQIVGALRMGAAWRCPLPLLAGLPLMRNHDPRIRAGALTLIGFSRLDRLTEHLIVHSLDDRDPQVQIVAMALVGRLRLASGLDRLVSLAHHNDGELARAACMALSMLGTTGEAFLQNELVTSDARSAGRAAESLARLRLLEVA